MQAVGGFGDYVLAWQIGEYNEGMLLKTQPISCTLTKSTSTYT